MSQSETRVCQNCKELFVIDASDFQFYEKMKVPPPTFCPQCRFQRRLSFMNERILYKRICDLCKKNIITAHSPDSSVTVYCNACWWSDAWDPLTYAREYDPQRPFFEQLKELIRSTPQVALETDYLSLVNCDYVNHSASSKNCYLIFTADYCENVLYSSILANNKDSMDCLMLGESELCYSDVNCGSCYMTFFSEDCNSCQNSYFLKDCRECSDCFGCINLRNKQYHIFNEPYSKEEYEKKIKEFEVHTWQGLERTRKQVFDFWAAYPHRYMHAVNNANVDGDYVYNSKNAHDMLMVRGVEDSRYCQIMTLPSTKDAYDYTIWGNGAQRIYEVIVSGEGVDCVKFSYQCWPDSREVEYCSFVISSSHMFGCANIRKKQYCILNKQYSKEEYEKLKAIIIRDMDANPYIDVRGHTYRYGEFLPPDLSLFAYNESYAIDFFPLTRGQIQEQKRGWRDLPMPSHKPTLTDEAIPGDILETPDSVTKEILQCIKCSRSFLIVPAELALLRRFGFPIPRQCFNCRYLARMARINLSRLWNRVCAKCNKAIQTSYPPDSPCIVYCEQCYQVEVV